MTPKEIAKELVNQYNGGDELLEAMIQRILEEQEKFMTKTAKEWVKKALKEQKKQYELIMIELAYYKFGKSIVKRNIDHLEIIKKMREVTKNDT